MTEEVKETGDYPFKSWDTFFTAFTELLNTEYAGETYPKYVKYLDNHTNYDIIKSMYKKYNLDANEGISSYIYTLCHEGTRYADNFYNSDVIDFFLNQGADFPTSILFENNKEKFDEDVQEECYTYDIRASILDDFGEDLKLDVSKYTNWEKIEAESIEDQEIEDDEDSEMYDLHRFKHLKYLSSYLQEFKKSS
jgi:hypothetical protein